MVRIVDHGRSDQNDRKIRKFGWRHLFTPPQAPFVMILGGTDDAGGYTTVCEHRKRAAEGLAYNALVQSFPEITHLAREGKKPKAEQTALFGVTEE